MGKREASLKNYFTKLFGEKKFSKPRDEDFRISKYNKEISSIYLHLGGIQDLYPTNYRSFDIQCNNFIVELDEERHFNRYRLLTLDSSFYNNSKEYFDLRNYKEFCRLYEVDCLKSAGWSGNWENNSTKKQFGQSDTEGTLKLLGSSRWKQRAFYDFLRDVSSELMDIPIIRISIWEKIGRKTINDLMKEDRFEDISRLIIKRIEFN